MYDPVKTDNQVYFTILFNPMKMEEREQFNVPHEPDRPISYYLDFEQEEGFRLAINGKLVEEDWNDIYPDPGDRIGITLEHGLQFAAWMGGMAANFFAAGASWGTWAAVYYSVTALTYLAVGYGVSTLISYAMNALVDNPDDPDNYKSSQTYSWGALTQREQQGLPIQQVFGKNKVAGVVLNKYTSISDEGTADLSDNTSHYHIMLGIAGHEVDSIDEITINGDPESYYQGITTYTRLGTATDAVIPSFDQIYTHHNYGYTLSTAYTTIQTDGNQVNKIELDFMAPSGFFRVSGTGKYRSRKVKVSVEYQTYPGGGWSAATLHEMKGNTPDVRRLTATIDDLTADQYEIRIKRMTADASSTKIRETVAFIGMREIIKRNLIYPGIAKYAVSALATDQLSGAEPVFNCMVERQTIVCNNMDMRATNPAWICYYILETLAGYSTDDIIFAD